MRLDFPDDFFHRVNVVHVLEHLPNLPACIDEVARVLKADGIFQVVAPCDPGASTRSAELFRPEGFLRNVMVKTLTYSLKRNT